MRQFRRERDVVTTQLATETNRLIIRVEKVGGRGEGGGGGKFILCKSE